MSEEPVLTNTSPNFGIPPDKQNSHLQSLGAPHIDSFNYMLDNLADAVRDVRVYTELPNHDKIELWLDDVTFYQSMVPTGTIGVKNHKIYPTECRQRGATYKGKMIVKVGWSVNGMLQEHIDKDMGDYPIMIKSKRCHLNKMTPAELVAHGEHEQEWGGYFVVKGHERLVRMLVMTRRNYATAVRRPKWKGEGAQFSDLGVLVRCVRDDNTAVTNILHYVTDGTAKFSFRHLKAPYYLPIVQVLKCLIDVTDKFIYDKLIEGHEDDLYLIGCVKNMLGAEHEAGLHSHEQFKIVLGKMFRIRMTEIPNDSSDIEVCDFIIKKCIAIHLDDPVDKFNFLIFMTRKLFSLANGKCAVEGMDAVFTHEVLIAGHLFVQIYKERFRLWLMEVSRGITKRANRNGLAYKLTIQEMLTVLKQSRGFESAIENFLATGNYASKSGLGLQQATGLTIIAENINRMRYMSHFRAIHRGSYFQEMRTTEARRLLPDAWGFICPVHTPDGAPCGLLNHLTMNCVITRHPDPKLKAAISPILLDLGMIALSIAVDTKNSYTVLLDGQVIGLIEESIVSRVVNKLRMLKIKGTEVPNTLEIILVPKKKVPSQYPCLLLFTGPSRMMRPVMNLAANKVELVGTFEQMYMEICVTPEEAHKLTTHQELAKTSFLSNLACLIPMPDCNQSPRNMYQCQMGKQTMGTPCHNWQQQSETKLYRLTTPATPFFRPVHYDKINLDDFAMGTNAIVAVISYTGYDMEDAMVINKASYERGFASGMIYKSEFVDLKDPKSYFARDPDNPHLAQKLDADGLPNPGSRIKTKDPYYCFYDAEKSSYSVGNYSGKEDMYIDNVKLCGSLQSHVPRRACITFRIPRNPSVGDKFASRAGQKGICSKLWPAEDLPFTETGLVPDIIFNPHGFPSRMTIAMMYEIMAGKSAAIHGLVHDATPFRFNEEDTATSYFGKLLEYGGYDYYGTERMYSGIDGRELKADIFFGVVHYQRLRHMVSDKWQVRSTGPMDILTRQPIKGRRRGGGVRFGEMERDSILSHGCPFLLNDRLNNCSDKSTAFVCRKCGTLIGTVKEMVIDVNGPGEYQNGCRICRSDANIGEIEIPYILRFLIIQLASVNINVKLSFKDI